MKSFAPAGQTVNVQACALGGSARKGSFLGVDQKKKNHIIKIVSLKIKHADVCYKNYTPLCHEGPRNGAFYRQQTQMTKENNALHSDLNQVRFQIELRVYNKIRMCNKSEQNGLSHLQCNISIFSNMIQ